LPSRRRHCIGVLAFNFSPSARLDWVDDWDLHKIKKFSVWFLEVDFAFGGEERFGLLQLLPEL
jgi:hypothetical protein